MNKITQILLLAIRFLFVGNPIRTSLGIILGLVLYILISIFQPGIKQLLSSYVNVNTLEVWECMLLGLFLIYVPTIISFIGSPKKEVLNEDLETVLRLIRLAVDEADLSEKQKRKLYLRLCEKAVEEVSFSKNIQAEIDKINKETELEEEKIDQ